MSANTSPSGKVAAFKPPCDGNIKDAMRSGTSQRKGASLTLNDIHDRAYSKWVTAGRPEGDSCRFWLEAEQELSQGKP